MRNFLACILMLLLSACSANPPEKDWSAEAVKKRNPALWEKYFGKEAEAENKQTEKRWKEIQERKLDRNRADKGGKELEKLEPEITSKKLYKVGSGSGFFVSADGYAITNHHVIESCQETKVHFGNNIYKTKILAIDKVNDLALLETNTKNSVYFELFKGQPKLMQEVFVAGFPIAEITNSTVKVTKGIVSSLAGMNNDFGSFMMDAALQPGNSGGPVFNDDGELLGVATATISKDFSDKAGFIPQNVNFGVKSGTLKNFLESNQIKPAKPSWFYSPSKEELVDKATISVSCWMNVSSIKQAKKNNPRKLMYKLPID